MRLLTSLAVALFLPTTLLAADPDPKTLAAPAETLARAKELVRQLDDDDIGVRDKASKELAGLKRLALPALLDALNGKPSNEVEIRIEKLLPAARRDDFAARYPAFLADTGRKFDHDLPGWNELKAAAGDTPEARKLFAAVLKTEERRDVLLRAFDTAPVRTKFGPRLEFEGHWARKRQARGEEAGRRLRQGLPPPTDYGPEPLEYLAAGLIADLMRERDVWVPLMPMTANELLKGKDRDEVLAGKGEYKDVLTKLAVRWVETRTDVRSVYDAATVCADMKLGEDRRRKCLEKSCELATAGEPLLMSILGELAKTGDRKYVATIRQFLSQEAKLPPYGTGARQPEPEVQQRDVALALCLLLTDQKPKEYGFDVPSD